MATALLRVSAPLSPYRDCDIAFMEPEDPTAPARAMCTDAETSLIIGSPSISPDRRGGDITPEEVIRMIGGTYRLAAIAIDIGTEELTKQTRRLSDELRLRRRLWRRKRRLGTGGLASPRI
ncbi:MAG: hypothetical protein AB1745_12015 [Pseudomonadota bacterium]